MKKDKSNEMRRMDADAIKRVARPSVEKTLRVPIEEIFKAEFFCTEVAEEEQHKIKKRYEELVSATTSTFLKRLESLGITQEKLTAKITRQNESVVLIELSSAFYDVFRVKSCSESNLLSLIGTGSSNCYSSTTVCADILTRLGKNVKVAMTPTHVWLVGRYASLETTIAPVISRELPVLVHDDGPLGDCKDVGVIPAISWHTKACALNASDRYEEELKACEKALEIYPNFVNIFINKSVALSNLGRYAEALEVLDRALEIDPKRTDAFDSKGYILHFLGRYDEALGVYDKVLEIDPDEERAFIGRGDALGSMDRFEEALDAYDKAFEITPENKKILIKKAGAFFALGRLEEAQEACAMACKTCTDAPEAIFYAGMMLFLLGRFEEAHVTCDRALAIDPKNVQALILKGNALYSLGRCDEALAAYDGALGIDQRCVDAWLCKCILLTRLERREEALMAYDKVREMNPKLAEDLDMELREL